MINPFITNGYVSAKYFCDRISETEMLTRHITNGNNVALISPRRLGKTGLIEHCFHQKQIENDYYTFLLHPINLSIYTEFIKRHFEENGKVITDETNNFFQIPANI